MSTTDYVKRTSKEYSVYVCSTRAIPKIEDGLKSGQRIALWLVRNQAEKIKVSALSGLMSYSHLFVHGEASSNNAISLMAAPYRNNVALLEGLGQFGSRVYPTDGIGSPRYVEVKRSKGAMAFLYNDLDLVPLEDNYDGSTQQPQHFLPIIPVVLLNGIEGVAVGWSTSILPRSLSSLIDATKAALTGGKIPNLIPYYEKYDIAVNELGPNQWEFVGKVDILSTSSARVTELPPGMSVETFKKRLNEYEEQEKILSYIENSTDRIDILVQFKRGQIKGWTSQQVIDFLKIKEKVTERITVVDYGGKSIKSYDSAEEVVKTFAKWRLAWYVRRYQKLVTDLSRELVYWKLLKTLFENGFTKKLGTFPDKAAMVVEVQSGAKKAKLDPDTDQIDRAVSLPTYRWSRDFKTEVERKIAEIEASIVEYQLNLDKPDRIRAIYVAELEGLKKL